MLELLNPDPSKKDFDQFRLPIYMESKRRGRVILTSDILSYTTGDELLPRMYDPNNQQQPITQQIPRSPMYKSVPLANMAEHLLAAIWEQQWPRLRRNFSFIVTNWAPVNDLINRYPSDLMLYTGNKANETTKNDRPNQASWVMTVEHDLISPGPLRRFLRSAGADVTATLQAMSTLAQAFMYFEPGPWAEETYRQAAKTIFQAFPSTNDARWLKSHLFEISNWSERRGFSANESIAALLDLSREYDTTSYKVEWHLLVIRALQEDARALSRHAATAFDDDDVPFAEEFRNEYIDSLSIQDLPILTECRPSLLRAALQSHPNWLEDAVLWTTFPERQENLLNVLAAIADNKSAQSELDWGRVMRNVADTSGFSTSGEWIRRIPLTAFQRFLKSLDSQDLSRAWVTALNARTNEVIEWMATITRPPLALLLWICLDADYLAMWHSELNDCWARVARDIQTYPEKQRPLLATQALCTMILKKKVDFEALLQILELVRKVIVADQLNPRHHIYLADHLPRLNKERDNWDIARRLDQWTVEILENNGSPRSDVLLAFHEPKQVNRLLKLIQKRRKT